MPYVFTFYDNADPQHPYEFHLSLEARRCVHRNPATNGLCKRTVCIGLDLCFQHLEIDKHLKIKPSTINGAGKGLFAFNHKLDANDILFRKGDIICRYEGQFINEAELVRRYRDKTAPYALILKKNECMDSAHQRYIGSLINHKPKSQSNAEYGAVLNQRNNHYINTKAVKNIKNNSELFVPYFQSNNRGRERYELHEEGVSNTTKYKAQRRR